MKEGVEGDKPSLKALFGKMRCSDLNLLRIGLVQMNATVGDIKGNRRKIVQYINQAKEQGVDIVAFPELAVCGYPPEDLLLRRDFVDEILRNLFSLLQESKGIVAIIGFVDRDNKGRLYNAAAIVQNKELKGIYRKIKLPNYGVFDEKRYFEPGKERVVFEIEGIRFAVNICEDIWKEKGVVSQEAQKGAQIIFNLSASPYYAGKAGEREQMLTGRAKETGAYVCYVNLVGGQDEIVFDGGSMVIGPTGERVAISPQFEEDLLIAEIPFTPRSSSIEEVVRLESLSRKRKPPLPRRRIQRLEETEEIYRALVLGTRDYIKKNNFRQAVIGLSGGIDSSLSAVIACDAIGRRNVIGISMPSRYSSRETQRDAERLAKNLGIRYIVVSIDEIFQSYLSALKKEFRGLKPDITEENLQARIRGNILMAFSNKFGWLVLTTGNKSETSVGYCTLYGDTAGGFALIKDVPKTLVYTLAHWRNAREKKELIPKTIFERPPSAELKENQKDEDYLPPYPVLDRILKAYIEEERRVEEIAQEIDARTVKRIVQLVDRNEYKRRQSPPGIKISARAFGKDRRFPITNKFIP